MTLSAIKELLVRRIARLGEMKNCAESIGDIERVESLAAEIAETQTTLDLIDTLG